MNRLETLKTSLRQSRNYSLLFFILFVSFFRLYLLPGFSFNQQNWDDEIEWINDSNSMSSLDYLFYRDAPGYFVLIPRVIILIGESNESFGSFSSLRILVLAIQFLCFAAAASCVAKWRDESKFWLLVFATLSLTYIEDLNYVHNVGYLFIFPIFLVVFKRIAEELPIKVHHVVFSLLLISKPFTAVIVLLLSIYFSFKYRRARYLLTIVALYSLLYLAAYVLLPHRWSTPFNTDPVTIIKLLVGIPWIVIAIFFPAFSIGIMGIFRLLDIPMARDLVGLSAYALALTVFLKYRSRIFKLCGKLSNLTKGLLLIFATNYALVFSGSDSFWNKSFPLFKLESPQFLWARWSAVLPLVGILIISSTGKLSLRIRTFLLVTILSQWMLLTFLGHSRLSRYW